MLRSCYRTKARFFRDDPSILSDVQWFFVSDDTPWLDCDNTFTARTWYGGSTLAWPLLGEVEGARRTWVNGAAPPFAVEPTRCGSADVFVQGVPADQANTAARLANGQLLCCLSDDPPADFVWQVFDNAT